MSASRINKDKGKKMFEDTVLKLLTSVSHWALWKQTSPLLDITESENVGSLLTERLRLETLWKTFYSYFKLYKGDPMFKLLLNISIDEQQLQYIHSHAFTCARQTEWVRISWNSNNRIVWLWPMLPRRQAPWICDERREIREQRWRQSERQTWQRDIVRSRKSIYQRGQQLRLSQVKT